MFDGQRLASDMLLSCGDAAVVHTVHTSVESSECFEHK